MPVPVTPQTPNQVQEAEANRQGVLTRNRASVPVTPVGSRVRTSNGQPLRRITSELTANTPREKFPWSERTSGEVEPEAEVKAGNYADFGSVGGLSMEYVNFMKQSLNDINKIGENVNLLQVLESENLSPEARLQIQQMKENNAVEIQRINEDINNRLGAIDSMQGVMGQNAEQMQGTTAAAKALLGGTAGGQANAATGGGAGGSARTAAENTMSGIASELLGPNLGDSGGWMRIEGGAETPSRRAAQAEAMDNAMITLGDTVEQASSESGEPRVGGPSSAEAGAISAAAEAQLDYMGIQDEYTRNQLSFQFQNAMSNEVVNLVRERQDVRRAEEQNIAAIELDDANTRADRFGVAQTTDPLQVGLNQGMDFFDEGLTARGVELQPFDEPYLNDLITTWTTAPEDVKTKLMQEDPTFRNLVDRYGVPEEDAVTMLNRAAQVANRAASEVTDESKTTYEPGSTALAYQLASAGRELGVLSDEEVEMWSNSHSAHQLINMLSEGNTRKESGATKRGIFALPEDVYEAAGYSWEEVRGNPNLQMQIGIAVLSSKYGTPSEALKAINEAGGLDLEGFRGGFTANPQEEEQAPTGGGAGPTVQNAMALGDNE